MNGHAKSNPGVVIACACMLLCVVCFFSLCLGVRSISPRAIVTALADPQSDSIEALILWSSRLPRLAIAALVGAALGLSGAILQTLTRNILADPGLLGINSGAALAVVICVVLLGEPPPVSVLGTTAILGACLTGMLVYTLAGGADGIGRHPLRLLLAGTVIMLTLGSLMHVVLLLVPNTLEVTQLWLAGSVADRPKDMLPVFLPGLALAIGAGLLLAPALSILVLGTKQAQSLGVDVVRLRAIAVLVAAVLCGLAVSLAGPVAFVGLAAPHAARGALGPRPTTLFPLAAIFGAVSVVVADALARLIVAPAEWPIGVLLAIMGIPVYLSLLQRRKGFL
ncbi:MAG: iron ABC transporter permease [Pseudomonadota bacterium]